MSDALSKYLKADKRFLEADKDNQLAGFEFNDAIDVCNVASMELFKDHEDRIKALEEQTGKLSRRAGIPQGRSLWKDTKQFSEVDLDAAVKAERERCEDIIVDEYQPLFDKRHESLCRSMIARIKAGDNEVKK